MCGRGFGYTILPHIHHKINNIQHRLPPLVSRERKKHYKYCNILGFFSPQSIYIHTYKHYWVHRHRNNKHFWNENNDFFSLLIRKKELLFYDFIYKIVISLNKKKRNMKKNKILERKCVIRSTKAVEKKLFYHKCPVRQFYSNWIHILSLSLSM